MVRVVLFWFSLCLFGYIAVGQARCQAGFDQQISELGGSEIGVVLKMAKDFRIDDLGQYQNDVGSVTGDILTLRLPASEAMKLKSMPSIDYIQIANKIKPNSLGRALKDMRADSVQKGLGLSSKYTGKDVIIGVTDWGFDYTHPMFYDTAMQQTRILAAWDQFKTSGPPPKGYDYGAEYVGADELLAAEKDTANIYGYATHGTHVAGIAGGGGAGTVHRGVAYEAEFLFATFLVDEAAVIDAFVWMRDKALQHGKRLVINMSWGLYNLGPLDGTSLVSQAIDQLSEEGVVFVTSGGNNGDVDFHIKKEFNNDTLRSRIDFYSNPGDPNLWGQSISMWGQKGKNFQAGFEVYSRDKTYLMSSSLFNTQDGTKEVDSFLTIDSDTIFYRVSMEEKHPLNDVSHIRLRIRNTHSSYRVALKSCANDGVVHFYNVTELTTDVGNWGMPFVDWVDGWEAGDNKYSLGEPASTRSVITVGAHQSEIWTPSGLMGGGFRANFSSYGPTIDERMKPDVSAPGVSNASSVSSFTDRNYDLLLNAQFLGKNYPFARFSGTSMSSPATAGVVALMLEANSTLYADAVKEILQSSSREDIRTGDLSESGDVNWGWGKVDALDACIEAEQKLVGLKEPEVSNIAIYPNPATSVVHIQGKVGEQAVIYSLTGMKVLVAELSEGSQIPVGDLLPGCYFLQMGQIQPLIKFIKL